MPFTRIMPEVRSGRMVAIKIALVVVGLVCLLLGLLTWPSIYSTRSLVRRLKELEDVGIETEARVVSLLQGDGNPPRARATLEVDVPGGDNVRKAHWMPLTPALLVGSPYPIVRHHQFPSQFEPGTKTDLAPGGIEPLERGRPVRSDRAQSERGAQHVAGEEVLEHRASLAVRPVEQIPAAHLQDVEHESAQIRRISFPQKEKLVRGPVSPAVSRTGT